MHDLGVAKLGREMFFEQLCQHTFLRFGHLKESRRNLTTGHLDFSFFQPFRAGFGGLKPAGSGLLACSRP
jgi:hypothetical protein